MSTILLGPYLGEFGYELMRWQGAVRHYLSYHNFDRIVVGCRKGHEYLYERATEFIYPKKVSLNTQAMCADGRTPVFNPAIIKMYEPCIVKNCKDLPQIQLHKKFGVAEISGFDLLIHARDSHKYSTVRRNWPYDKWVSLAANLYKLEIGSIGTINEAMHIPGTTDLRGTPLSDLVNIIASAKLVVGPVSGAIHLTALCGTPHITWTNKVIAHCGTTNKKRCEELWNPFKTPVTVVEQFGWNPPVNHIQRIIEEKLS